MTPQIDYRHVSTYWTRMAASRPAHPDCAASLNPDRTPLDVHRFCRRGQLDQFVEMLGDLDEGSAVLDLGCGPGLFSLELAHRVRSIVGIDLAPAFVEAARAEAARRGVHHARFEVGSFVERVPEGPCDLVLLSGVLVYVGDEELSAIVQRVAGVLRPGGRVFVRVSYATGRPWRRAGTYHAIYRRVVEYERAFADAELAVVRSEPDRFYTYYDLLIAYFGLLRVGTLGFSRRRPSLEDAMFRRILAWQPYTLEAPRRMLQRLALPLPHSCCFLLRKRS